MSAVPSVSPARPRVPPVLELYRDDGPLSRAIGGLAGPLARVPQVVLIAAGAVPMFLLMSLEGDGASHTAVGAALAWLVVAAGASSAGPPRGRLGWAVPGLLRLAEYAGLLWIGALAGESSQPAAFALLCVLTFRHYDLAYRPRHQDAPPPRWVGNLAGGWDGRLVLGYILLVARALPEGFFIAAGLLATVFVAESVAAWRRPGRAQQPITHEDEEDEGQ